MVQNWMQNLSLGLTVTDYCIPDDSHCSWFVRFRGHFGSRRRAAMSRGHLGLRRGPAVSRDHLGVQRGAAVGRGHLELRNRECHEPEESLGNVKHLKIC